MFNAASSASQVVQSTSGDASRDHPPIVTSASGNQNGPPINSVSPELIALITQTVQAAVAAERANAVQPASSSSSASGAVGGVPVCASSPLIPQPAVPSVAISGVGNPSTAGRPASSFAVPSFISTFAAPAMSIGSLPLSSPAASIGAFSVAASNATQSAILADQPFVIGPGFSPVPSKLVSQIVAGKYVDLSALIPENLETKEPSPQFLLDGHLLYTPQPKKPRRKIEDIATWLEAFAVFSYILLSYYPHRWKDLLQYQLLILRTYRQFSGRVWLSYDQAFRENAAATKLTDWSVMNSQLFNFHAAGSAARPSTSTSSADWEPTGSSASLVECISWNKGRCTAPRAVCRYAHRCTSCSGLHRAIACSSASKRKRDDVPRRSSSPGAERSSSKSKSRRS